MSKSIFIIGEEYARIEALLYESGGEITDELELALAINHNDLERKGEGYVSLIRKNEADIDIIDSEIKRLTALKKVRVNLIDRLKERVRLAMETYEIKKIDLGTGSITLCEREGVEIIDDSLIPQKFITLVQTEKLHKDAINKAVMAGEEVPGTEKVVKRHLMIK